MKTPLTQFDAMELFIGTFNKIENVDMANPLVPHVFTVYRAYAALNNPEISFSEYIESIAVEVEDRITTLEGLTNFKVPNEAASVCPIIPGLTIAKASAFLLGLMPAASKFRRDAKMVVRKKLSTLDKLFGLDKTSNEQPTNLQLAEAV